MLVEIQCDKFIKNGLIREPITFHKGLNVVLGDDNGSNSIGKSTFLMILDFVFGGSDYVKKCLDVQENVGEHTINFAFDFDGNLYYFSRNTVDYNNITECDERYSPLPGKKKLTRDEYCLFLRNHYGVIADDISWRGAVSRFIRVYKRETLNETDPLQSSNREKPEDKIKLYMQLFKKYSMAAAQIKKVEEAKEEKEVFKKSTLKYGHVRSARTKAEKDQNEKLIAELEKKEKELVESSNEGLLDLDDVQARRLAILTEQLLKYKRQLAHINKQLNAIRSDMEGQKSGFKRTFTDLERFFPNADFKTLAEIEQFHRTLSKVLAEEFSEAEKDLIATRTLISEEVEKIKTEIKAIKNIPNVSQAILKEFASITTQLNNLREANRNFDELERLKQSVDDYSETRDALIADLLSQIEAAVNQTMKEITILILKKSNHFPPEIKLEKMNKYSFSTPNDGGTGAQQRGLITFDLANLSLTAIPFLVHDSVLHRNIEKAVFAEIVKAYIEQEESGKQIFMAYDMIDSYGAETQELLKQYTVIKLSPNGNELFGWAWNKKGNKE